jgi:hypothetical protein
MTRSFPPTNGLSCRAWLVPVPYLMLCGPSRIAIVGGGGTEQLRDCPSSALCQDYCRQVATAFSEYRAARDSTMSWAQEAP